MQNLPTLRQMQYLVALAEHQSFQKAASACNVTQSTLSGGLADMETILKTPLIDRAQRRIVSFTPVGQDVLAQSRAILAKAQDMTYRAKMQNEPLSWPLRLGVIPTIAPYLLPRILKPLEKALPKLELHIHEIRSAPLVEKVQDGSLDLALMAFPYDTKGLFEKTLFTEKFVLAAPPGSFVKRKNVSLRDLESEKLLLLEDGHCLRDHALEACKLQPLSELKTFSAASLSTLIQMVHQGYGMTLLPDMCVRDNPMLPKRLVLRPLSGAAPKREIGFAWKRGGARESDIELVVKAVKNLL